MDGPVALDVLGQAWGDVCYIGHQPIWRDRRKDDTGRPHAAPASAEPHKMIADDHVFIPVRRAS